MHENRLRKIQLVQALANQYYEPERLDRCLAEVWRKWVYPQYPICYETFRRYMAVDLKAAKENVTRAQSKPHQYDQTLLF
ncbi:MAG: hypothetical protein SOX65_06465 [Porphyromonas sp.]|uniref:hypothetical protein n=1 Tax=Porphyromonas sp. TaxID=1924944 RepID=UPI002A83FE7A|nr:hypothetical protein [Porphyromonas sp.]MDY4246108.1 hypothetical protein [Porphyromonas sp.]